MQNYFHQFIFSFLLVLGIATNTLAQDSSQVVICYEGFECKHFINPKTNPRTFIIDSLSNDTVATISHSLDSTCSRLKLPVGKTYLQTNNFQGVSKPYFHLYKNRGIAFEQKVLRQCKLRSYQTVFSIDSLQINTELQERLKTFYGLKKCYEIPKIQIHTISNEINSIKRDQFSSKIKSQLVRLGFTESEIIERKEIEYSDQSQSVKLFFLVLE